MTSIDHDRHPRSPGPTAGRGRVAPSPPTGTRRLPSWRSTACWLTPSTSSRRDGGRRIPWLDVRRCRRADVAWGSPRTFRLRSGVQPGRTSW